MRFRHFDSPKLSILIVTDDLAAAKAAAAICRSLPKRGSRAGKTSCLWERSSPKVCRGPGRKRIFFQSNGIADEDLAVGLEEFFQVIKKKLKLKSITEI